MIKKFLIIIFLFMLVNNVNAEKISFYWNSTYDFSFKDVYSTNFINSSGLGRVYPDIVLSYDTVTENTSFIGSIDVRYSEGNLTLFNNTMRNAISIFLGFPTSENNVFTPKNEAGYWGNFFGNVGFNHNTSYVHSDSSFTFTYNNQNITDKVTGLRGVTGIENGSYKMLFDFAGSGWSYGFFNNPLWMDANHSVYLTSTDAAGGRFGVVMADDTTLYSIDNITLPSYSVNGTDYNETIEEANISIQNKLNLTINLNTLGDTSVYYVHIQQCPQINQYQLTWEEKIFDCVSLVPIGYANSTFVDGQIVYTDLEPHEIYGGETYGEHFLIEVYRTNRFNLMDHVFLDYSITDEREFTINMTTLPMTNYKICLNFYNTAVGVDEVLYNTSFLLDCEDDIVFSSIFNSTNTNYEFDGIPFICNHYSINPTICNLNANTRGYQFIDGDTLVIDSTEVLYQIGMTPLHSQSEYYVNVSGYILYNDTGLGGQEIFLLCEDLDGTWSLKDKVKSNDTGFYISRNYLPLNTLCSVEGTFTNLIEFYTDGNQEDLNLTLYDSVYEDDRFIYIAVYIIRDGVTSIIDNAQVTLLSECGGRDYTKLSDDLGVAFFSVTSDCPYKLVVEKDGYDLYEMSTDERNQYEVYLNSYLDCTRDIEGILRNKEKVLLPHVTVNLIDSSGAIVDTTKTDENGYYIFKVGICGETYTLDFNDDVADGGSGATGTKTIKLPASGGGETPPDLGDFTLGTDVSSSLVSDVWNTVLQFSSVFQLLGIGVIILMSLKLTNQITGELDK